MQVAEGERKAESQQYPVKLYGVLSEDGKAGICSWGASVFGGGKMNTYCLLGPLALMLQTTPSLNLHCDSHKNIAPKLSCGVLLWATRRYGRQFPYFHKA